jgi:sugar fermentation stimulation protein A
MQYNRVITGTFIDRPNRFIAMVEINESDTGQRTVSRCHVKNTGR